MKTAFARALVALSLVSLPATALASTKASGKHNHSVASKEPKKKAKHHAHKSSTKAVATHSASKGPAETKASEAKLDSTESKSAEPKAP